MARKPELTAEHGNDGGQHYAQIVRPEMLGQWAIEKNPTLRYLHEPMQDWGERRSNPSRRPMCLTCPHEFRQVPIGTPAWMFVRLSVNKAGVPWSASVRNVPPRTMQPCCGRVVPTFARHFLTCPSSRCRCFRGRAS